VYFYLQTKLHKYRLLLLLPFLVSHCLFYLSLHYPAGDSSRSFKEAPTHFTNHGLSIEALQVAKVRQLAKTIATSTPVAVVPVKVNLTAPVLFTVGQIFIPSFAVAAFHPPALFPSRASPV
jgi:hypothetical protein